MTVYLFDTECTDKKDGEIIEAAWLRVAQDDNDLFAAPGDPGDAIPRVLGHCDQYTERFKPAKPTTMGALAVHHILPVELEGCRPTAEFELPADCTYVIGHSIDFDWTAAGSPPGVKRICTHAIAQHLWLDATGYSLVALTYMTKGANATTRELVRNAHRALDDCLLAYLLLGEILALKTELRTWSALWAYSEECRIPRVMPLKRWEGVLLEDMDDSSISWCLRQDWLCPYLRKGLERVVEKRYEAYGRRASGSPY